MPAGTTSRLATAILHAALAGAMCAAAGCESPKTQDEVVVYCSADQQIAEPILAAFTARTGIRVRARYDIEASKTVGLVQRIRAEGDRPLADVFWSSEVFYTIRLAREGLLAPYAGAADWPKGMRGVKRQWHGFAVRARVIAYNTNRVKADDAPRTLEDCLDAKWKGRLVMARPTFGTTGGDVASWFAHYGEDKARRIIAGLKANDIRITSGNSDAARMVARGEADICFTDTDDVYAGQRNGWPIAFNYLDQGGDGVLVIPNTVAIVRGGPNSVAAGKLVEFLLSEDVERMLVESDSHNTPIRPSLAEQFPKYAIDKRLEIDYGRVEAMLTQALRSGLEDGG